MLDSGVEGRVVVAANYTISVVSRSELITN